MILWEVQQIHVHICEVLHLLFLLDRRRNKRHELLASKRMCPEEEEEEDPQEEETFTTEQVLKTFHKDAIKYMGLGSGGGSSDS